MPRVRGMQTAYYDRYDRERVALRRLAVNRPSAAGNPDVALPFLLRAPTLAVLWALALLTVVGTLAIGRIRLPNVARGVVTTVRPIAGAQAHLTLMILEPTAVNHVRPGQLVTVDTGGAAPMRLAVSSVEPTLLDLGAARARFRAPEHLAAHLDSPKLVAYLTACTARACLTPQGLVPRDGGAYRATLTLGIRTLASYALPRS